MFLLPLCAWALDGQVELGGMVSRGNSTVNQIKGALELNYSSGNYSAELKAGGLRESGQNSVVTTERADMRAQFMNKGEWTRGQYLFVAPQWRYNRFAYLVRATEIFVGTGWQWGSAPAPSEADADVDADCQEPPPEQAWKLRFEAGPGYRYSQLSTAEEWWEPVFLLRAQGDSPLGQTMRVEGELALEIGEQVTELLSRLALVQQVTDRIALKLVWSEQYTVPVAPDKRRSDSSLALSLAYRF